MRKIHAATPIETVVPTGVSFIKSWKWKHKPDEKTEVVTGKHDVMWISWIPVTLVTGDFSNLYFSGVFCTRVLRNIEYL